MNSPVGAVASYVLASYGRGCEWTITKVTPYNDSLSVVSITVPDGQNPQQDINTRRADGD